MKIIYISSSTIPSRTANSIHVMKMCQAFVKNGHELVLLAPDKKKGYENLDSDCYKYYGVSNTFQIKKLSWFYRLKGKSFIYGFLTAFYAWLYRPGLVYCRNIVAAYFASWMRLPLIFESHAPVSDSGSLEAKLFKFIVSSGRLKKLIVITHSLKKHYLKQFPHLAERIVVAPDGADPVPVDVVVRDKPRTGGQRFRVGYVGHLYTGKGMEVLTRLAVVCPWADFCVVGGTKEDIDFWKSQEHSKNIIFYGYVSHSEVWLHLSDFDLVLLPNQIKVFAHGRGNQDIGQWTSPLKLFEYMAAKKTIIASDIPVLREILTHEKNALLCPPEDIQAWKDALLRLFKDKALSDQLASAANECFLKNYTWQARAKKLLDGLQ